MSKRFSHLEFREAEASVPLRVGEQRTDEHTLLQSAHAERRWGRFEPALRLYTRCLENNRAVIAAWVGQVQMLVELGEYHEARMWSDKSLELFRNNGELLAAKAQACARLQDRRAAQACTDGSLQVQGSSALRWIARGEVLLASGERHYEECFRKALIEPTADWFDRVLIARVYQHYQRWTNALSYLKQALALEAAHGYVWFEMGNCQSQLGLISAARVDYERCLELRPDYREARDALAAMDRVALGSWFRGILRRLGGR